MQVMESDHMAVKLDKQATSYTSYTDLLPRPIPPTYDCSNYHIAPVGPQPSPLQLGKEPRQRFTNVLTLCWSHLTVDTFCIILHLLILSHTYVLTNVRTEVSGVSFGFVFHQLLCWCAVDHFWGLWYLETGDFPFSHLPPISKIF